MVTVTKSLDLARTAGSGSAAWVVLQNTILGNSRKRVALAKRILMNASAEHRELYFRFFPNDGNFYGGWHLLCDIAAKK